MKDTPIPLSLVLAGLLSAPVFASAPPPSAAAPEMTPEERQIAEYLDAAESKLDAKDFLGASLAADRALSISTVNAKAYQFKSTALNRLRRYEDAEGAALRALVYSSTDTFACVYDNLAFARLNLGRYDEAIESAGRAVEINPSDAQALMLRAYAFEQVGERKAMVQDIERAEELNPGRFTKELDLARRGKRLFTPRESRESPPPPSSSGVPLSLWVAIAIVAVVSGGIVWYLSASRPQPRPAPVAAQPQATEADARKDLLASKYELRRIIGKGGMGEVWDAKDHSLNRTVAIKRMSAELGALGSQAREYYLKEARTVASLHHPHIIGIYEILDLKEGIYLVFEMASGKTVQHLLAEARRLSLGKTRRVLRPVCDALDFAHSRGVVHRDLKPANIMLTDQGFIKVMDFGIARRIDDKIARAEPGKDPSQPRGLVLDRTRTIVGTPAYMAPEAEQGIVSSVSDVYSLGICLYEMLTGALPYGRDAGMQKYDRGYPKARAVVPELPGPVDELIYDALDPNPESRIPSAREFLARLEGLPEVPRNTDRLS